MSCRNPSHDAQALIMADNGRRCSICWTPADVAHLQALEFRGLNSGLPWVREEGVAWPYGPNLYVAMRESMLKWAESLEMVSAVDVSHLCLPWLTGRIAHPHDCAPETTNCWLGGGTAIRCRSWQDHPTYWAREDLDGKLIPAVAISHPYGSLSEKDLAELRELDAVDGIKVNVRPHGESWYAATTLQVEVWNTEEWGEDVV